MSSPKFRVGEVVILQSRTYPQHSGQEYTVHRVLSDGEKYHCRITGAPTQAGNNLSLYGYLLTPCFPNAHGREALMAEQTLRKKHIPGEMRFYEMMNAFKKGATA